MKNLFLIFLFFICSTAYTYATKEKYGGSYGEEQIDKFQLFETEVKKLISKIENLEREISLLKQVEQSGKKNLDLDPAKSSENDNQKTTSEQSEGTLNSQMKSLANKTTSATTLAKKIDETTDEANSKKVLLDQENKKPKDQKQIYERGLILIKEAGVLKNIEEKNSKLSESEAEFKQFITNFPNSELISNAYFWYGETFFQRKDYNKAAVQYLKSYKLSKEKNLVKNNKAVDSLVRLSISLAELKKPKDACNILDKIAQEFPKRTENLIKKESDLRNKIGCK